MRPVVFDMDGVLADFIAGFTGLGHELMPDKVAASTTEATTAWRSTPHDRRVWDAVVKSPTFWRDLPALVSRQTMERVARLANGRDTYFVTSRVGVFAKAQTEEWLTRRDVVCPTVVITARKGEACAVLGAEYAIDDKAGNAVAISWMSRGTRSFLLDRPYNRMDHGVIGGSVSRVPTVDEFLDAVEG